MAAAVPGSGVASARWASVPPAFCPNSADTGRPALARAPINSARLTGSGIGRGAARHEVRLVGDRQRLWS
jgi:hypothetical protein